MSLWSSIKKIGKAAGKGIKAAAGAGAFGPWGAFASNTLSAAKRARKGGITAWQGGGWGGGGGGFSGAGVMGFGPMLPAIGGAVARSLPAIGRVAGTAVGAVRRFLNTPGGKWTKQAIRDGGLIVVGGLVYDAAGNLMGSVQRRRMNPLNARALRRAIRRVKSARGICRDVESMLPKRKAAAPCAPRKRC